MPPADFDDACWSGLQAAMAGTRAATARAAVRRAAVLRDECRVDTVYLLVDGRTGAGPLGPGGSPSWPRGSAVRRAGPGGRRWVVRGAAAAGPKYDLGRKLDFRWQVDPPVDGGAQHAHRA